MQKNCFDIVRCKNVECENLVSDDSLNFGEFCPKFWELIAQKAKEAIKDGFLMPALDETFLRLIEKIKDERSYNRVYDFIDNNGTLKAMSDFFDVLDAVVDAVLDGEPYRGIK
jgi:hypothetical protein